MRAGARKPGVRAVLGWEGSSGQGGADKCHGVTKISHEIRSLCSLRRWEFWGAVESSEGQNGQVWLWNVLGR